MRSLWESGLRHVLAGESTIEELLRVTDVPLDATPDAGAAPEAAGPAGIRARRAPPARAARRPARRLPRPVPSLDFTMDLELVDEPGRARRAAPSAAAAAPRCCWWRTRSRSARVMKDLLEREGYIVAEARDGVQALDEVDRHAPDIIVLDLNLPGLDGYSVLQQLRSRPATRGIPVMVLTAKGDEDNEVRVFELGADDFITKPFRARALSARLEAVLGRHRA